MRTPPPSVIASWPRPNFINPETRGPLYEVIAVILLVVVTFVVALRLYTRRCISHGLGWDDFLIAAAWVPAVAFTALGITMAGPLGWNRHIWDVPRQKLQLGGKIAIAGAIIFDVTTSLTKLSILALLHRLALASGNKKLRVLVNVLSVIISLNCIIFIVVIFVEPSRVIMPLYVTALVSAVEPSVHPILALPSTTATTKKPIIDDAAHLLAAGTINTATDFLLVLLPMIVVFSTQELTRHQVIVINILFGIGLLATAAGVVRTYFTWVMSTSDDFDVTWHGWTTWLSSTVELDLSIICASVPAAKPFFARYFPRLAGVASRTATVPHPSSPSREGLTTPRLTPKRHTHDSSLWDRGTTPNLLSPAGSDARLMASHSGDKGEKPARRLYWRDLDKPLPAIVDRQDGATAVV